MLPEDYILLRFMLTIHRVSALWSFGQNAGDLKMKKNIGLVIIDYLQLMTASVKRQRKPANRKLLPYRVALKDLPKNWMFR